MAKEVTIEDVRVCLNEIDEEEVTNATIQQKIDDAVFICKEKGIRKGTFARIKFIRSYAALKSFVVSNTYSRLSFGDISLQREWRIILDELKKDMEDALLEAGVYEKLVITSTPMFDDRPVDDTDGKELTTVL